MRGKSGRQQSWGTPPGSAPDLKITTLSCHWKPHVGKPGSYVTMEGWQRLKGLALLWEQSNGRWDLGREKKWALPISIHWLGIYRKIGTINSSPISLSSCTDHLYSQTLALRLGPFKHTVKNSLGTKAVYYHACLGKSVPNSQQQTRTRTMGHNPFARWSRGKQLILFLADSDGNCCVLNKTGTRTATFETSEQKMFLYKNKKQPHVQ